MLKRILNNIRRLGWLNTGLLALSRLLARASGGRCSLLKYQFVAQAVAPGSLCHGRGLGITIRLCRNMAELPPTTLRPAAVLAGRFAQGAVCLAALRETGRDIGPDSGPDTQSDSGLRGFLWLLRDACQEDEVRVRYILPSSQSAWDLDVWVHPDARLGLTFARLWEEANRLLHADGVRWSCSRISAFNVSSLSAHARIGTLRLGSATFLRCGRWQWMASSIAPYFHLSRSPTSFPSLWFDTSGLRYFPSMELTCRILKQ
ncbi:hypothetical protein [Janthinobacterium agaricidamnosum]|nr:hypothetical protein [Janthinobacterium agaricidamnosum]